jgi:hypothetical protein
VSTQAQKILESILATSYTSHHLSRLFMTQLESWLTASIITTTQNFGTNKGVSLFHFRQSFPSPYLSSYLSPLSSPPLILNSKK